MARPFLSVITRHLPARADLLERNQASLRAQTDPDYEQIVITDEVGRGWAYAQQMLAEGVEQSIGRYILILDDDDVMEDADGIASLKMTAESEPPAIIFRGQHADMGVLPKLKWGEAPQHGDIGCFDFILRRDVFLQHVNVLAPSGYAHDFYIIDSVYQQHASEIVWLDQVICAADQRRLGVAA